MEALQKELEELKLKLRQKDEQLELLQSEQDSSELEDVDITKPSSLLTKEQVTRYSRQLLLPQFGVAGQSALLEGSVLVVGAGGLGCPSSMYLAAAGVGRLGIIDYDTVELGNLHRQILHSEERVGQPKVMSAAIALRQLNSSVSVTPYHVQLDNTNAADIITQYDVVLDCTDNPATRYLLNDACVLLRKPLVSGSALRMEGQLTVYNYKNGPCYRCLYPSPPDPKFVTNCSDGGVLGPVPGLIGTLQAMEGIKILLGQTPSYWQKLLVFDGETGQFRCVKIRPRQAHCAVCGDEPSVTDLRKINYSLFCGRAPNDKTESLKILEPGERISAKEFCRTIEKGEPYLLVDVRPELETQICRLPVKDVLYIPYENIDNKLKDIQDEVHKNSRNDGRFAVYVVCRRGNNSQLAVKKLKTVMKDSPVSVKDIIDGIQGWAQHVDPSFPVY